MKKSLPKLKKESYLDVGPAVVRVLIVDKATMREMADLPDNITASSVNEAYWVWTIGDDEAPPTILLGDWVSPRRRRKNLGHELIHALNDLLY